MSKGFGIGLTGSNRTGKTALARAFSLSADITLIETSSSKVYRDMGYDPKEDYNFDIRMDIQERILGALISQYDSAGQSTFVTDRTPLDFLAYTMADVGKHNVKGEAEARLASYIDACYETLNKYFNVVVRVQPGIPIVEAEGKAPANLAFMEHLNVLITGFGADPRSKVIHTYIPRDVLNMAQRVRAVEQSVIKVAALYQDQFNWLAKERGAIESSTALH